jgi:dihydropteroate synthase
MPNPKLMAIINCTPDSFYAGGRHDSTDQAIAYGLRAIEEGADILDIGGESTRPGSDSISEVEEIERVVPVVRELAQTGIPISIDTTKPEVARLAVAAGGSILNDVTGFSNPEMQRVALECDAKLVIMHMQGAPRTMQHNPSYPSGVISELLQFFEQRVGELVKAGIHENRLILDPGIGFGKDNGHNVDILFGLDRLKQFGLPILFGASRKSFMTRLLNKPPEELLSATIAVNTIALLAQVDLIRVHDVPEHRDVIDLLGRMRGCTLHPW